MGESQSCIAFYNDHNFGFNYSQNVSHVKYSTVFFFQLNSHSLQNIYSISYLYFGALSTSAVVLVGVVVSYITGERNSLTLLLTQ